MGTIPSATTPGVRNYIEYEYRGGNTWTRPIPTNCVAWEVFAIGAGGGGGAARGLNSAAYRTAATGGGGGSYVYGIRAPSSGATEITIVCGSGGAGGIALNAGTAMAYGTDGGQTTVSDGTITFTAPGGKGGLSARATASTVNVSGTAAAIGSVSDGGDVQGYRGGFGATAISTNAKNAHATGGGSAGGWWGNGQNSGYVTGTGATNASTGGASVFFSSGYVDFTGVGSVATGGAGTGGKSGFCTSYSGDITGGGGNLGPGVDNLDTEGDSVQRHNPGDGGLLFAHTADTTSFGSNGQIFAGADAGRGSSAQNATLFGGGGGAAAVGTSEFVGGNCSIGGGGGGSVNAETRDATGGEGGYGYVLLRFYTSGGY